MKKQIVITILCCVIALFTANAQGVILDKAAYKRKLEEHDRSTRGRNVVEGDITEAVKSLREYCPPPSNQGSSLSCTGHAVGNAMSIVRAQWYNLKTRKDGANAAFSAMFIYNQIHDHKEHQEGASIESALEWVKNKGDCTTTTFGNDENCNERPPILSQKEASRFKIAQYEAIFNNSDSADTKQGILNFQKAIVDGKPVIVIIKVSQFFKDSLYGKSIKNWKPTDNEFEAVDTFSHALCLIGYDKQDETFELMNSWGNQWGDGGFIRVSQEHFMKVLEKKRTKI